MFETTKRKARDLETLNDLRLQELRDALDDDKVSESTKGKIRRVLCDVDKLHQEDLNGQKEKSNVPSQRSST